MFVDFRTLEGNEPMTADVVIVGSGPAGIAIAREFLGANRQVCLIESGDPTFSHTVQSLAQGDCVGLPYFDLDAARYRRFGGSMNGWPSDIEHADTSIAPMNRLDFEPRDWIPDSGWPFPKKNLDDLYARAQRLFQTGPWNYDPRHWSNDRHRFQDFDDRHLITRIWQYSPGLNFGRRYADELRVAGNIIVLTNATATEILTDEQAVRADGVRVSALSGKTAVVRGRLIVLACGGIENARLLLLSRSVMPMGLGNGNDLVGRYFMEHPHIPAATVRFTGSQAWLRAYKNFRMHGVKARAGICLSEQAQIKHRIANHSGIVVDRFLADRKTERQSPGYMELKKLLQDLAARRVSRRALDRLSEIARDLPDMARGVYGHFRGVNGAIYTRSEQVPNPDSRVTLSDERDRLGQPRARLDWRMTSLDKRTIRVAIDLMGQEFARLGLGEVVPDEWLIADDHSWPRTLRGGYHHMGTTRMSATSRTGVVDPDCRVHGMANLYVAGSSVFPTGGYANPTLTLVAVSLRLADHLKLELARPLQELAEPGPMRSRR